MQKSSVLTTVAILVVLLVLASQVQSSHIATSNYYLDTPLPITSFYVGKYGNGTFFAINGSNWRNFVRSSNASYVYEMCQGNASSDGTTTIMFAGGTYEIQIGDLVSNLTLCSLENAVLKLANGANGHLISSNDVISNVRIEGLTFDGNGDNQVSQGSRNDLELLQFINITNFKFVHNSITYTRDGCALKLEMCDNAEIASNTFSNSGWNATGYMGSFPCDHIYLGGNKYVKVYGNHFKDTTDTAIASNDEIGDVYYGNTFEGLSSQFITIWGADYSLYGQYEWDVEVSSNIFYGVPYNVNFTDNNFAAILISNSSGEGIPSKIDISDNQMYEGEYGVYITWGEEISIDGNMFFDHSNSGIATERAVDLAVNDNYFDTMSVGVKINVAGSSTDDFSAMGNHFSNIVYSPFWIVTAPANYEIKNNYGYLTRNYGTTSMSSNTSVVVYHGLGNVNETVTPTIVLVTPNSSAGGAFFITAITATTFTVNATNSNSDTWYWIAEGKPS